MIKKEITYDDDINVCSYVHTYVSPVSLYIPDVGQYNV